MANSIYRSSFIFLLAGVFICAGCTSGQDLSVESEQTISDDIPEIPPVEIQDPAADEQGEEESTLLEEGKIELSKQRYSSLSESFEIALPSGWNCSETGQYQVNCQAQDQSAEIQARITGTGYELVQDAFLSFAHAELVYAYADRKEYIEIDRSEIEGRLAVEATWRKDDQHWQGEDLFIRSGASVFHLHTAAHREAENKFTNLFNKAIESVELIPSALHNEPVYSHRFTYTARAAFFEIDIPTSWGKFSDAVMIKNTIIEGYNSPDMRASAQIATYYHSSLIEQAFKAEKTLEIMRAIYGYDLRVSHDKALPDGRERLAWYAENKDIHGISYFDTLGSSLYIFTIVWEKPSESLYLPVLTEIEGSFNRE